MGNHLENQMSRHLFSVHHPSFQLLGPVLPTHPTAGLTKPISLPVIDGRHH
jgi:hypothetical protein